MIIPPPPRSPPSKAPATSASVGGTGHGQLSGQAQQISQQNRVQNGATPLTAAAQSSAGAQDTQPPHPAGQQPVNHSGGNGTAAPMHAVAASSSAHSASGNTSNGANGNPLAVNGTETTALPKGVNGAPQDSVSAGIAQNVQSTGVNGFVGADRTNGQAQPGSSKGQPHAGPSQAAGDKKVVGFSDLEGDGVKSRDGVAGTVGTSRSDKVSGARIHSSSGGAAGRNGTTTAASELRAVGLKTGSVARTAGENCALHDTEVLKELQAKLTWAHKEGRAVSVHVETAYEVFGEAVLQWMPLPWLGDTHV